MDNWVNYSHNFRLLRFLKNEVSIYFVNMGYIHIDNHLTNQLINQSTISANFLRFNILINTFVMAKLRRKLSGP
jgi:hypothetical protein